MTNLIFITLDTKIIAFLANTIINVFYTKMVYINKTIVNSFLLPLLLLKPLFVLLDLLTLTKPRIMLKKKFFYLIENHTKKTIPGKVIIWIGNEFI